MKNTIVLLLLFFSSICFSQKVKKVKENSGFTTAQFYVLKSDGITKHGAFKLTTSMRPVRELALGNYNNGKPEGIWEYYNFKGELIQQFDFEQNQLVMNSECGIQNDYDVEINGVVKSIKLNCPPTRLGGLEIFKNKLYWHLSQKATSFNKDGSIRTTIDITETLSFFVSQAGKLEQIEYSGKDEFIELSKFLEDYLYENRDNWIPGNLNNEKVKAKISIPIRIRIVA